MSDIKSDGIVKLVHPLYLDVPMMTSFLAAIEGGIAYDSNIKLKQGTQKEKGASGEAEAGVPKLGILSSVLNLSLRGKIEGKTTSDENEEIELVRKHTEASLFMQLHSILHYQEQIILVQSEEDLQSVAQGSLVEVTGQILRSPAGEALENFFKMMNMMGLELSEELPSPNKPAGKGGQHQHQTKKDPFMQIQEALESGGHEFALKIMQRLKDDLTKSKVVDVVMQLSSKADVSVIISLASEFLPEEALDNLLSGHFTVLGKITRVLEGEEEVNLYQRSTFGNMLLNNDEMRSGIEDLQQLFGSGQSSSKELIKAPGIQLIPLAVFV